MNYALLVLSYLSLFSMGLIDNVKGPAYPLILNEFNLDASLGAWFFSISAIGGMLSTLSHTFWLPRIGPFIGIRYFILTMSCASFGLGYLSYTNYPSLLFFSFLFGVSSGGVGICMNLLTPWSVPQNLRRRAFAGLHSTYALSSLIAPLLISFIISCDQSWRLVFQVYFIIPFLLFIWSFYLKKPRQKIPKNQSANDSKALVLLLGITLGINVAAEVLISTRLVLYCKEVLNYSLIEASLYLSYFFSFLLLGRLSFAFIHLKGSNLFWIVTSTFTSLVFVMLGLYIHPFFLSFTGLTMSFFFPCYIDWISELYPDSKENIISSMLTAMGIMIVITHNLMGFLNQNFGLKKAMLLAPFFYIIALGCIFKIINDKK